MRLGSVARVGIEIMDDCVHAVEVVGSKRNLRVSRMVSFPIDSGLVVDGDIQNQEELGFVIREQFKVNEIHAKFAQVVVPSRYVVIRQLSLQKLPKNDVHRAIEFELQNHIHLPFEESVFDFAKLDNKKELEESLDAGEGILEGNVELQNQDEYVIVAASKPVVEKIVETAEIASLKVKVVDVRALALYRLYMFENEQEHNEEQTLVFVDIGELGSDIHIFRDSYLLFTRNVPLPLSNYLNESVYGFGSETSEEIGQNTINFRLFAQDLAYELERSINFYQYSLNNRDQRVRTIILTGKVQEAETVIGFLSNRLDVEIDTIRAGHLTNDDVFQNQGQIHQHAVSIGLAIREDKRSWK